MNIKLNDVYSFWYNEEWRKKIFDPNWCFDGQLIVKKNSKGELYLEDTYWGSSGGNKSFTLEEALQKGELTFICNLDEVEKCKESDLAYYDDKDLFNLSTQHGCHKAYYKRKEITKSIEKMEQVLNQQICKLEHEIEWQQSVLERTKEKLEKLKNGDMEIYI